MALSWCPVCGGNHASRAECPGDLRATGPERHGWRVAVETPFGVEAYGVLVAASNDLWRARIITYPNVIWTVPGGAMTLKFAGKTAQEAESRAIAFVEGHIKARGYARHDAVETPSVGRYRTEAAAASAKSPASRKLLAVPVRFGAGTSLFTAMTANLSESGLFVVTLAPLDPGTGLRVLIDLETGPTGLKGEVVWTRPRMKLGRPAGMGVQLDAPPAPYREFVREIP